MAFPMNAAEIAADLAVRESPLWPCQAMRPGAERFPRTFIAEDVNMPSARAFASRLTAFKQSEVFKGCIKDLGFEEAIVSVIPRGTVVSESRAVMFVSIPRAGKPLPEDAPSLRLQARGLVIQTPLSSLEHLGLPDVICGDPSLLYARHARAPESQRLRGCPRPLHGQGISRADGQ
mgnify:CR=1 FL=1